MENEKRKFFFADLDSYKEFMNKAPLKDWIKTRSLGGTKQHSYLPIEMQQAVADQIFDHWNVIDEKYNVVMNEIVCTIKLQYLPSYPYAEERFATGSASKPIQQKSETPVSEITKHKIKNALEYNIPAVRSSAISNAFESLGNIFGRNISRKNISNNYKLGKKEEK